MAYFIIHVKDDNGRNLQAVIEAKDKNEAKQKVRNENYFFISAEPCKKDAVFSRSVPFKSLAMFTHRLMSMLETGIPILAAMNILWRQTEDTTIQLVVSHLKLQLEEGASISAAMDDFPKIFPPVYRSLMRVGEMGGSLVPILRKLSEYLDYQSKVIERTKRATMYPTFVIGFALVVIIAMFAFVVPTFQKVLFKLNVPLPMVTKIVLIFSSMIRSPWFIIGFPLVLIIGYKVFTECKKDKRMGLAIDRMIFKLPYFGEILYLFSLNHVIRSLSILLGAGVPIMDSFDLASATAANKVTTAEMTSVKTQLEQGRSLYDSFRSIKEFPVMLVEMIGIGESSGLLVNVLEKVTKHFDEEVDYQINRFLTILEPALTIFVGVIVVVTLLAIYLPIVSIWQGLMNR